MFKKFLIAIALALVPLSAFATIEAFYDFEGNLNDTSGNGHHGSETGTIVYTQDPAGFTGDFTTRNLDNVNFPTIPNAVFDNMQTTGSMHFATVTTVNSSNDIVFEMTFSGKRFMLQHVVTKRLKLFYPSTTGEKSAFSSSNVIENGTPYLFMISWTPSGIELRTKDLIDGTTEVLISDSSFVPDFSGASAVQLAYRASGGLSPYNPMDSWEFFSTEETAPTRTYEQFHMIRPFGSSYVAGSFQSGCGDLDGWRMGFFDRQGVVGGRFLISGTKASGTSWSTFHDGIAGNKTSDIEARLISDFNAINQTPTINQIIMIPNGGTANDDIQGVSVAGSKTNITDMVDLITAESSLIKILLTTFPNDATGFDVGLYNTAVEEVFDEQVVLGRNVFFIDIAAAVTLDICADNLHATETAFNDLGVATFDLISAAFASTPAPYTKVTNFTKPAAYVKPASFSKVDTFVKPQ